MPKKVSAIPVGIHGRNLTSDVSIVQEQFYQVVGNLVWCVVVDTIECLEKTRLQ